TDAATLAYLLKHDTVHGVWDRDVKAEGNTVKAGNKSFTVLAEKDPANLPWKQLGVDVVVESTGFFTKRAAAAKHLAAGARKVVISAPADDADSTIVIGVNDQAYDKNKHEVVSIASCTTNCLAPVAKVLNDTFGIVRGVMTTIHAYTNDQRIADQPHKDLRRARAAAMNIIPTSTGAAKAIGLVLPELAGRLDGIAVRVPVADGSLVDLVAEVKKPTTVAEVNAAFKAAASKAPLKGILEYREDPIVSSDVIGNPHSSIFDSPLTSVMEKTSVKVFSWYDNEWGYSSRVAEFLLMI
ncbi:MAG TPA: type I glyceraldehyde-3-phosphate dehydrogenase, partial [Candidatus Udaeobacter sp.]|nr:type I glyceraldehyde-3-phosphate dehydrogenase [Candidatus Udaeobacter sp.]